MAQEDLDAKLDELMQDGDENPQPAPEAAAQPGSEAHVKLAELDALVPDDAPEAFRGKPISEVLRVAEQHKYEAGLAAQRNQQWNQMQAERDAARLALQYFQQQQAAQQQQAQAPSETQDEYLQRLASQPREVIHGEVDSRVDARIDPVVQELQRTRSDLMRIRGDQAQFMARNSLGIDPETWSMMAGPVSTFMAYNQWPLDNPDAWAEAGRRYVVSAQQIVARTAQGQNPPPTVEVPRPGAPPNGAARSAARPASTRPLKPGVKSELEAIASAMGLDDAHKTRLEKFATENYGGQS